MKLAFRTDTDLTPHRGTIAGAVSLLHPKALTIFGTTGTISLAPLLVNMKLTTKAPKKATMVATNITILQPL